MPAPAPIEPAPPHVSPMALTEAERPGYFKPILRSEKWTMKLDPLAASPMLT